MTATTMTIEQRNQIVELCKQHIDEQGSVRVGWAAEKILGQKPQHNMLDKVSAIILLDGQYVKEAANPNFSYDWNIRRNPNYKREKWTDRNPIGFEILKGLITAIFSIIVSVILTIKIIGDKREDDQKAPTNNELRKATTENFKDTLPKDTSVANKK